MVAIPFFYTVISGHLIILRIKRGLGIFFYLFVRFKRHAYAYAHYGSSPLFRKGLSAYIRQNFEHRT